MNYAGIEAKISLREKKSTFNYKLIYHAGWMCCDPQLRFWCSNFSSHLHSTVSYHPQPLNLKSYLLTSSRLSRIYRVYSSVNMCMAVFSVRQRTRMPEFSRQAFSLCQAWGNVYVIRRQEAAEYVFNKEVERKVGHMLFLKICIT